MKKRGNREKLFDKEKGRKMSTKREKLVWICNTILLVAALCFILRGPREFIIFLREQISQSPINHESWCHKLLVMDLSVIYVLGLIECFCFFKYKKVNFKWLFPIAIIFSFLFANINIALYKDFVGFYSIWDMGDMTGRNIIESYSALGIYNSNYPPVANIIFKALYELFPGDFDVVYVNNYITCMFMLFITVASYVLLTKYMGDSKLNKAIVFALLLSEPMLFLYQRQNLVGLAFIFVLFFLVYFNSENVYARHMALLALALAANIKLYPAIFGLLLLKQKRWKDAVICAMEGIGMYILPALILAITKGENFFLSIGSNVRAILTYAEEAAGYTVSIKAICARVMQLFGKTYDESCAWVTTLVLVIFLIITLFAFFITRMREKEMLFLSLICIMLPAVSYWYTIIFLFIPFCEIMKRQTGNRWDLWFHMGIYFCLFICTYNGMRFLEPNNYWQLLVLWGVGIGSTIKEARLWKSNRYQ